MNDLYKKLSLQAFDSCAEECTKDGINQAWIWERTYAELIIRECLSCLGDYERRSVLRHFGLED